MLCVFFLAPLAHGQNATLIVNVESDSLTAGDSMSVWIALTHSFCYRVGTVASVECYPKKATHEYCQQNCSEGNCGGITSSV